MSAYTGASSMSGGAWVYMTSPDMRDDRAPKPSPKQRLRAIASRRPTIAEARMWLRLNSEITVMRMVMADDELDVITDDKNNVRIVIFERETEHGPL